MVKCSPSPTSSTARKWYEIEKRLPEAGSYIIAELSGSKLCTYLYLTVREGEGLGHIKKWAYVNEERNT